MMGYGWRNEDETLPPAPATPMLDCSVKNAWRNGTTHSTRPYRGTVYVSGPMRGQVNLNFAAFDAARDRLVELGYDVISPADIDRACPSEDQRVFAQRDFAAIHALDPRTDMLVLLDGWQRSTGALAEVAIANWLSVRVAVFRYDGPKRYLSLKDYILGHEHLVMPASDPHRSFPDIVEDIAPLSPEAVAVLVKEAEERTMASEKKGRGEPLVANVHSFGWDGPTEQQAIDFVNAQQLQRYEKGPAIPKTAQEVYGCSPNCSYHSGPMKKPHPPTLPYLDTTLPVDKAARKAIPLVTGLLDYFPAALAEIAALSAVGNKQHNPGEPLHWARHKSTDTADALLRHLTERGTVDDDGVRHSTKVAWRALALLQLELEANGAPVARGAK